MNNVLKFIVLAPFFGFALACVPPYPNTHGDMIWLIASIAYVLVSLLLRKENLKSSWLIFGIGTFFSFIIPMVWFNYFTMMLGAWYPPDIFPIIQAFVRVDGEASYDAHISNLFFIFWVLTSGLICVRYLTSSSKQTP
jgi:hypothetical protein